MFAISKDAFASMILVTVALAPLTAVADSGFYIGASAGGATIESDLNGISIPGLPAGGIDEDDTAIKIFAGYNFDLPAIDLAIEAGYVDFGEPDIDTALGELTLDTTGINAWGIAAINAGPVDIFGKLGLVSWEVDADLLGASDSDDGTDIGYGLGVRFNLGAFRIRGEYELYDVDEVDVSMLSLGIVYQF